MNHPTKEERERYIADCNRGGICRFDMESAIRNNIIPPLFPREMFDGRIGMGKSTTYTRKEDGSVIEVENV